MAPVGFFGVLDETRRIIHAHSRHFLGLSVLFLLPISFLSVASPTFKSSFIDENPNDNQPHQRVEELLRRGAEGFSPGNGGILIKSVVFYLVYTALLMVLNICATSTIVCSINNGFFGRPVKFLDAIASIPSSSWRLFLTILSMNAIIMGSFLLIGVALALVLQAFSALGFQFSSPPITAPFIIAFSVMAVLGGLYVQVNWAVAFVIAVVEGSWGIEPLRRSAYLMKGMRTVPLFLTLFFSLGGLVLWWVSVDWLDLQSNFSKDPWNFPHKIAMSVLVLASMTVLLLYGFGSIAVLYLYSKALHNELASAIVKEFSQEYMSLPFDEHKVPHVVTVV
ncbi:hypothetical protein AMTRI_Chr10g225870 [Amborella trichopoda]|uniref:Transmembrane protein n=1 Tax=Amborella trichopoda TaxID=13333 RepID=W1P9C7_AMBTC|nr:uncharacterized protein LOC18434706 [Amborella trichopoda]ERN06507.1 hypothetical protein AMTR_s00058p00074470 [Amborella trichopoda]|eukprot:XP_006844832.1 uncharacterized protein LOC18434706 [Amborella trichopoda]